MSALGVVALIVTWLLFALAWRSADLSWRAALVTAAVSVAAFAGLGLLLAS